MKHRNTDNFDRIIAFVNDWYRVNHNSPTGRQISAGTGISLSTVQRMLNTMSENGAIYYDGESIVTERDFFMLHARGDSMTGAGIEDGDMVLIKKQEEAYPGQIVVAYVEGEGNTLKTYKEKGGKAYLHPENPKYADIPLRDCRIQGIAVSVTRKLNA